MITQSSTLWCDNEGCAKRLVVANVERSAMVAEAARFGWAFRSTYQFCPDHAHVMAVHGHAPGPGHALVVNVEGFHVNEQGLPWSDWVLYDDPDTGLALSGEGFLACLWLAVNPTWRPDPWPPLGTYVKLPITHDFRFALASELERYV